MTSPAALDILRRTRLPFEARSTAVRGTHRQTGAVFYLWMKADDTPAAAVFEEDQRNPSIVEAYVSQKQRERMLARYLRYLL